VYVGGGSHVLMTGNVIEGGSAVGIELAASDSVVELNVVTSTNGGIQLDSTATGCRVASNVLDGATGVKLTSPLPASSYGENNRLSASGPMRGTVTLADAACGGGTPSCGVAYTAEVLVPTDTVRLNRVQPGGTLGHLWYDVNPADSQHPSPYIRVWSTSNAETSVVEWEIVH
jgi:hypothetical protein